MTPFPPCRRAARTPRSRVAAALTRGVALPLALSTLFALAAARAADISPLYTPPPGFDGFAPPAPLPSLDPLAPLPGPTPPRPAPTLLSPNRFMPEGIPGGGLPEPPPPSDFGVVLPSSTLPPGPPVFPPLPTPGGDDNATPPIREPWSTTPDNPIGADGLPTDPIPAPPPRGTLPDTISPDAPQGELPSVRVELDGSGSYDPEGEAVTFHWRQTGGPPVRLSDPTAARPHFLANRVGLYVFELIVASGGLQSEPAIVEVAIEPENRAPVAAAADAEILVETGRPVRFDASASRDPDNDPLLFRWTQVEGESLADLLPDLRLDQAVVAFIAPNRTGVFEFELEVSDGDKNDRTRVRLVIRPPRKPPQAVIAVPTPMLPDPPAPAIDPMLPEPGAVAPPLARIEGPGLARLETEVVLDGRASRTPRPGQMLTYVWTQKAGPFVRQVDDGRPRGTLRFVPREAGEYHWELTVNDDPDLSPARASTPQRHIVTATRSGQVPVARLTAPATAQANQVIEIDGRASEGIDATAEFRWRQTDGPHTRHAVLPDQPAILRFQPADAGDYEFELVIVADGIAGAPAVVRVAVTGPNRPPVVAIEAPEIARPGDTVILRGSAQDPDGDPLRRQWRQPPDGGPRVLEDRVREDRLEVVLPTPGTYVFAFEVTDGINHYVERRAVIRVQ